MLGKKSMPKRAQNKEKMPELLTLKEACEILKCHPNTLRQWDKKGILIAIRIGVKKVMRYHKNDILKLLNNKNKK
jgi:excisionase family DNA binding protein